LLLILKKLPSPRNSCPTLEDNGFDSSQEFPYFMETEGSLTHTQVPGIYPYPETGPSNT